MTMSSLNYLGMIVDLIIEELVSVDLASTSCLQSEIVKRLSLALSFSEYNIQKSLRVVNSPYNYRKFYALVKGKKISYAYFSKLVKKGIKDLRKNKIIKELI